MFGLEVFWALMKCPKVVVLPKSNDIVLRRQALLGNPNRKFWTREFFWALMKCKKFLFCSKFMIQFYDFKLSWASQTENVWTRGFFWAPLKCPNVTILPKSYDIVLSL